MHEQGRQWSGHRVPAQQQPWKLGSWNSPLFFGTSWSVPVAAATGLPGVMRAVMCMCWSNGYHGVYMYVSFLPM
jgi:hypothetical protein